MINAPKDIMKPPEVEYTNAQNKGLLQGQSDSTTLEQALAARRNKLAEKKINLEPNPMEVPQT